jgi:phosphoglycolate phosphatase-like HAD superfamily hydrolase
LERYGRNGVFEGIRFDGRSDPEIIREGLNRVGAPRTDLDSALVLYLRHLEAEVAGGPALALPGVVELLEALSGRAGIVLGLVTGNVRRGAEIKLGRDALLPFFRLGAYGDESPDRGELVRLARRRAEELGFGPISAGRVAHVGDTEADIRAARAGGALAVAVATGAMDRSALAAFAPDHLFDSLLPASRFIAEVLA